MKVKKWVNGKLKEVRLGSLAIREGKCIDCDNHIQIYECYNEDGTRTTTGKGIGKQVMNHRTECPCDR